ncbi:uncharacterized protein LOC112547885 isoform X3 [Alligator sinensis]|uniref:Gypsy retrotransposon integrase-like protein 1 n=1 Tax=Alligator sinensis TaxID=38654 RepID=A0A3Q0FHW5_ALLSI|nr:uncharacterized protein LOC112547885 isoform X1 [Alligator sinensis]XP_025046859.1 uncharacterized protein LOC112547885 isoform X2 [Alligator sinensis]XP_025046860.1 uncharacterized protein LOC112547885 isoform X3 [Alligator sinensis]
MMDQILLEQFIWDLEEDTQRWVQRHQPQTSEEALHLAEVFANSERERGYGQSSRGPKEGQPSEGERRTGLRQGPPKGVVCYRCGQTGHISRECGMDLSELSCILTGYPPSWVRGKEAERVEPMDCSFGSATQDEGWNQPVVTAWIGDRAVKAKLDTGCSQSLLQADLTPQTGRKRAGSLTMTCILGGEMRFQTCYVPFRVMEFSGEPRVRIAPTLACEMILGREWGPFYTVLERVRATEEERNRIRRGEGWAGEGPACWNEITSGGVDLEQFVSMAQCRRAQNEDPELQWMWDTDPGEGSSRSRPGFEVIGGLLYRVQRGEEGTIQGRQLVVPSSLRQAVWKLAHDSPMGGHLGRNKTRARLAQEFFWPRLQEDVERWGGRVPGVSEGTRMETYKGTPESHANNRDTVLAGRPGYSRTPPQVP